MSAVEVHNIGFYTPKLTAISHLALHKSTLAVARSDNSIELWDLQNIPYIQKIITPSIENYSIEGLAWLNNRLFSVGLHGFLFEYDLFTLEIKARITVTGEAAYCIDSNEKNSLLAVGTEMGYINLFTVTSDSISFDKLTNKQENKVLCIKFAKDGSVIATGSINYITTWNVSTGNMIHKMRIAKETNKSDTIVWALEVMSNNMLISGDSRGKLCFWDDKTGSLIDSYKSHQADISTICLEESTGTLYCSGVDYKIASYKYITIKEGVNKWVRGATFNSHINDVKGIVLYKNDLYSGGISGCLIREKNEEKMIQFSPVKRNCCKAVPSGMVLFRYGAYLEICKLGKGVEKLEESAKKLLVIGRKVKNHKKKHSLEAIYSSDISNDGKWIAFCTHTELRLLNYKCGEEENPIVEQIDLPDGYKKSLHIKFTPDNKTLLLIRANGAMQMISLCSNKLKLVYSLEKPSYFEDTVTIVRISPCGKFLITSDTKSNIIVWNLLPEQIKFLFKLPKYSEGPIDLSIDRNSKIITVQYSDLKVIIYDLEKRKTQALYCAEDLTRGVMAVKNVSHDMEEIDDMMVFHDDKNIYFCKGCTDKDVVSNDSPNKKKRGKRKALEGSLRIQKTVVRKKYLAHVEWISPKELVVVEVNPESMFEQLPPSLKQNKFGTK